MTRARTGAQIAISAIEIMSTTSKIDVLVGPYTDHSFALLREREDVFCYRDTREHLGRQTFVVPLVGSVDLPGFASERVPVTRHGRLFVRLVEHRLPDALPALKLRHRKFALERVRERDDLVAEAFRRAGFGRPPALARLRKHHRTKFFPRLEFVRGRGVAPVIALQFDIKFQIVGTVADLIADGADVRGLCARNDGGFAGRIVGLSDETVTIAGEEGPFTVAADAVTIERSHESFSHLFRGALGTKMSRYAATERRLIASKLAGRGYLAHLGNVAEHLRKDECVLAPGISFRFGDLLEFSTREERPAAMRLPAVQYCFSPDRGATDALPARGLERHGPFDGRSFERKEPHLLVVGPAELRSEVERFVGQLRDGLGGGGTTSSRGLVGTYRLSRVRTSFVDASTAARTQGDPGAGYVAAMRDWFIPGRSPDAAVVVLRDEEAFIDGPANPYLAAKAWLLSQGIPSQDVRMTKVRSSAGDLPYVLEDLAVALYAKLGGCPWTVAPSRPLVHEIVLGMAYAEVGGRFRSRTRYMGITTVFTSDGSYVLAATTPRCRYEEYAGALAEAVGRTVTRLKREQGWIDGESVRLVFHTAKPLTRDDISKAVDAAVAAVGGDINVEIAVLTVMRDHPFTIAAPAQQGRRRPVERLDGSFGPAFVGEAAPDRGLCIDLGDRRRLLVVTGQHLIRREGDPIPRPLLLQLHERSTFRDMTALTRQVFQLTGLSWRSVRPASEPATLQYPRLIAKLVGRLETQPGWSESLLDTRLARSRWFL